MLSKKLLLAPLALALLSVLQISTTAQVGDADAGAIPVPNQECNTSTVHNSWLTLSAGCGATPDAAVAAALAGIGGSLAGQSGVVCDLCPLPPPWFVRCLMVVRNPWNLVNVSVPVQQADGTWCATASFSGAYAVSCLTVNC